MLYFVLGIAFSISTFFLIRLASMIINAIKPMENIIDIVLMRSFPYISLSTPLLKKHALACHQPDGFYFTQ